MKKYLAVAIICSLYIVPVVAENMSNATDMAAAEMSAAVVNVPTGVYWNGQDFIRVDRDWVKIVVDRQPKEYGFRAERDPWGNYALTLLYRGEIAGSITIYSDGRSLYYNGTKYSKK